MSTVAAQAAAPVAEAKRALAPARAEAERGLKEILSVVSQVRPLFLNAQAKFHAAARLGIVHSGLQGHLRQLGGDGMLAGCMDGGVAAYREFIRRVDTLSDSDVYQGLHLRMMQKPTMDALRSNIGALRRLAAAVEQDLRELTERLKSAAPDTRPTVVEKPERHDITMETRIPDLEPGPLA